MKAFILDAGNLESCHPLTCTRTLGEFPIANRPLKEHQADLVRKAGLDLVLATPGNGTAGLFLAGNAWVSSAALTQLARSPSPAVLQDEDDRPLAWVNINPAVPAQAKTIVADGDCMAILYPWDLLKLNEKIVGALEADDIRGDLSPRATVEGRLVLGEGSRILPGVFIEGNVVIGKNCKIGPNCYLRGSTSIGDGCHVGQSVEIKNSILLPKASIGHLSYCGDSVIGEKVNWGAGTAVANLRHDGKNHRSQVNGVLVDTGRRKFGTIMGDFVHTGIHTCIYPGRKFWPHTSTRPGMVVDHDIMDGEVDG